jgi:D-psicose/D-tagatose/L-ribulose 3-epimerase
MRLLDLAEHANLFGLLDTYHFISEVRDYAAAVRTMAPKLWCVHTCENDRGVPGGGVVPWDDLFDALYAEGFDGPLTMEAYNSACSTTSAPTAPNSYAPAWIFCDRMSRGAGGAD